MLNQSIVWTGLLTTTLSIGLLTNLIAQDSTGESSAVVIERTPLTLTSPQAYQVRLQLSPVVSLPVVAPMDGIVQDVFAKPGDEVKQQSELLRLDSEELNLELKQAQANFDLQKMKLAVGASHENVLKAEVELAKRALDLAEFRAERAVMRVPITGTVVAILVSKGQFVRAGDLLARVIDPSTLYVEIPVERDQVETGSSIDLTVETGSASGKVDAILPPLEKFDTLRDLFASVVTARITIDSADGKFLPGQRINSEMVPRFPVSEVPVIALKTDTGNSESERMVQVIRDGFVRTIPVQLLGQVGQTHVFVSGRFAVGDELIVSSSEELEDGAWVRPMLLADPGSATGSSPRQSNQGNRLSPFDAPATNPRNDAALNQFQRSPIIPDRE